MKVNIRTNGDVTVVDLNGKITIGEGDVILRDSLDKILKEDAKKILLNLSRVSYMDSAGIGELVACYKRSRERGGGAQASQPVRKGLRPSAVDEARGDLRDLPGRGRGGPELLTHRRPGGVGSDTPGGSPGLPVRRTGAAPHPSEVMRRRVRCRGGRPTGRRGNG